MNVCLLSAFRDSTPYLDRYFEQVGALHEALALRGDRLRVIAGEGDSTDCTRELLQAKLEGAPYLTAFVDVTHGGPKYDSVVSAQRFRQLSQVWNALWLHIPTNYSAVLFVESDLIWDADTMLTLLDCLGTYPAIAPKILCPRIAKDFFYDSWAFRKDGRHFTPNPPYFSDMADDPTAKEPVQIDSAGSVLAIRGALARKVTWPAKDVVVGVCRAIYELGGAVFMHPSLTVVHP